MSMHYLYIMIDKINIKCKYEREMNFFLKKTQDNCIVYFKVHLCSHIIQMTQCDTGASFFKCYVELQDFLVDFIIKIIACQYVNLRIIL